MKDTDEEIKPSSTAYEIPPFFVLNENRRNRKLAKNCPKKNLMSFFFV